MREQELGNCNRECCNVCPKKEPSLLGTALKVLPKPEPLELVLRN